MRGLVPLKSQHTLTSYCINIHAARHCTSPIVTLANPAVGTLLPIATTAHGPQKLLEIKFFGKSRYP